MGSSSSTEVIYLPKDFNIYETLDVYKIFSDLFKLNTKIRINASKVEQMDGSGVQLLLWVLLTAKEQNIQVVLESPSENVSNTLKLSGLNKIISIQESI